jgi:hypothetical protein
MAMENEMKKTTEGRGRWRRVYISRAISAPLEWWESVERAAIRTGFNRSLVIRLAVEQFLAQDEISLPLGGNQ